MKKQKQNQLTMFTDDSELEKALEQTEYEIDIEQLAMFDAIDIQASITIESGGKREHIADNLDYLVWLVGLYLKQEKPMRAWRATSPSVVIASVWREESGKWYSYIEQSLITAQAD